MYVQPGCGELNGNSTLCGACVEDCKKCSFRQSSNSNVKIQNLDFKFDLLKGPAKKVLNTNSQPPILEHS